MSFTFEMDIRKGVLAIDIYNFIRAKQNDIGGAVLIYIAKQPCSYECTRASTNLIGKIPGRYKYLGIEFYLFVSHGGMKRQRVHV